MSKIKLSESGFTPIPEGEHTFTVKSVEYKEQFGKMEVHLETETGRKHTEYYNFKGNGGEFNDSAIKAFSYFARVAMNDMEIEEIEHTALVGKKFIATVEHEKVPHRDDPSKTVTFIRLKDRKPYVDEEQKSAQDNEEFDLDAFLAG